MAKRKVKFLSKETPHLDALPIKEVAGTMLVVAAILLVIGFVIVIASVAGLRM